MILYELAKQLEGAGYPIRYGNTDNPPRDWVPNLGARDYSQTYFAGLSLSELIEATPSLKVLSCGYRDKENLLVLGDGKAWLAESYPFPRHKDGMIECAMGGNTPEEAVARLWLALNPPADSG